MRKWLDVFVGIILLGLVFPLNLLDSSEHQGRKEILWDTNWGLGSEDPRIEDANARIDDPGRYGHDAKNLAIELVRWGCKTHETNNPDQPQLCAYYVKGLSALIVWPWVILLGVLILRRIIKWRRT